MICAFGSCNILRCSTTVNHRDTNSWVQISADLLNVDCVNYGQKAIDNNYIYHTIISNLNYITANDTVLVGWTDASSRLFGSTNVDQHIIDNSLTFTVGDQIWIRSMGKKDGVWDGNFNYRHTFGNEYYDTYFQRYYNEYISKLELFQKISSLHGILKDRNIRHIFTANKNIFFTLHNDINWFYPEHLGIVDYTKHANLDISDTNCHLTDEGHEILANLFVSYLNEL
jgi:hypothetical protein